MTVVERKEKNNKLDHMENGTKAERAFQAPHKQEYKPFSFHTFVLKVAVDSAIDGLTGHRRLDYAS